MNRKRQVEIHSRSWSRSKIYLVILYPISHWNYHFLICWRWKSKKLKILRNQNPSSSFYYDVTMVFLNTRLTWWGHILQKGSVTAFWSFNIHHLIWKDNFTKEKLRLSFILWTKLTNHDDGKWCHPSSIQYHVLTEGIMFKKFHSLKEQKTFQRGKNLLDRPLFLPKLTYCVVNIRLTITISLRYYSNTTIDM